ncbi:hypothetical protein [Stieleria tagensis]|uniref:hypothetical protein n=1 Tax=Stieleria tagensis TaxID=2956795 RepID=UPI00209A76FE|nr:hypothetical protein [Stieleria tagensis]
MSSVLVMLAFSQSANAIQEIWRVHASMPGHQKVHGVPEIHLLLTPPVIDPEIEEQIHRLDILREKNDRLRQGIRDLRKRMERHLQPRKDDTPNPELLIRRSSVEAHAIFVDILRRNAVVYGVGKQRVCWRCTALR